MVGDIYTGVTRWAAGLSAEELTQMGMSETAITAYQKSLLPPWVVALIVVGMLALVIFIVFISTAERRLPVQYAKRVVGRKMYGGQSTHIPMKVNMSGVMPNHLYPVHCLSARHHRGLYRPHHGFSGLLGRLPEAVRHQ